MSLCKRIAICVTGVFVLLEAFVLLPRIAISGCGPFEDDKLS